MASPRDADALVLKLAENYLVRERGIRIFVLNDGGYPMLDVPGREVLSSFGPCFRFFCYGAREAAAHADEAARRLHPFALHGTAYGRGREAKLVCSLDRGQRLLTGHPVEKCLDCVVMTMRTICSMVLSRNETMSMRAWALVFLSAR